MPVSFYTPTSAGTVPKANMATSLLPALGQGLLQAAQMYQNVKAVDKAAGEAAALFKDPTYANIFRQVGLAAVRNGDSPAPVINSMLSTAITLKRDEEQAAQRERMMRLQFGQASALENLRSANDMEQITARAEYQANRDSQAGLRSYESKIMSLKAEDDYLSSAEGQAALKRDQQNAQLKQQMEQQMEIETDLEKRLNRAVVEGLPTDSSMGSSALFDSGVDMDTPLSEMEYTDLENLEMDAITYSESSPQAKSQIQARLRAIQQEKNLRLDRDKVRQRDRSKGTSSSPSVGSNAPNVSRSANRYITP